MTFWDKIRWVMTGILGKAVLWLWAKSAPIKILGEEEYRKLRKAGKPVIIIVWHSRIFLVPYFFRHRGIMPLISPSGDGEIVARIMGRWGYKILRGSSSHAIIRAWNEMKKELDRGGEVIIVPDGPRGPNRKLKSGCIKLASETGAWLVPFTFSAAKKKVLKSWDQFLLFYPFSRVIALYGPPLSIPSNLNEEEFERERHKAEKLLIGLDKEVDKAF
ncbi:MAG: lysophospholipid acyltransferase family protein [Candidatus Aminicenantales bacterium]